MELDPTALSRARRSRDPRFDGRFFVGVSTTGIYCRPVCPAPSPRERNVLYFPTAAAAAEAGFRPCLRCRPETAPGSPAWLGTSSTVGRALRLMTEAEPERLDVEALASRLGIGARQLHRLFVKHLGAGPLAVAMTRRIHFAKQLIDGTDLPFVEVAIAAGFGSVRRFNAAMRRLYGRTPRELRALARRLGVRRASASAPASASTPPVGSRGKPYRLRLGFRAPFDCAALLAFLEPRATPGVETVSDSTYRRTIAIGAQMGSIEARLSTDGLDLAVDFPDPRSLMSIVARVRRMFDLDADPVAICEHLRRDPLLRRRLTAHPGVRVPGAWNSFELVVRAILGQQVTVRGATTLAGRLASRFGRPFGNGGALTHLFPKPEALAEVDLAAIGLPRARAATIRAVARAAADGEIQFGAEGIDADLLRRLGDLPGIGPWTVQYTAMRALGDTDAFPSGDLGLLRAAGLESAKELERRAEAWRPWRAYAAMLLWQGGGSNAASVHASRKPARPAAARRR